MRRSSAAERHVSEEIPEAVQAPAPQSEADLERDIFAEISSKRPENKGGAKVIDIREGVRDARSEARVDTSKEDSPEEGESAPLATQLAEAVRTLSRLEAYAGKSESKAEEVNAELEEARQKYQELRLEYVGDNIKLFADTKEQQIEARREALEKEKGFGTKVYDAYKKLGDLNLAALSEKLGMKRPSSRTGKIIAKVASVRTVISLGLVGVGVLAGAGTAVGIAAIAGRRVLSGMGVGFGTYDLLKSSHEGRLSAGFSAEHLDKMSQGEVLERMEQIEANALVGGKSLKDHKTYHLLKNHYVTLATAEQEKLKQAGNWDAEQMRTMAANSEMTLQNQVRKEKSGDTKRKVVATAAGVVVGSGLLAKVFGNFTQWFRGGSAKAAGHAVKGMVNPSVETVAPVPSQEQVEAVVPAAASAEAAAENQVGMVEGAPSLVPENDAFHMTAEGNVEVVNAPPPETLSDKMLEASEVHKGDGYAKIIQRDLMAEPEKFGYDPERDGKVVAWARKTAGDVMRKNGILSAGREMRFSIDPASGETPRIALKMENGNIAIEKSGIRDYVYEKPHAAPVETAEAPKVVEPPKVVEQAKPGAPVAVETETLRAEGNYDVTGSHLKGEEFELGHVEHEFKPLTPEQAKQAEGLLAKDYRSHLMLGRVKNPELVKHLLADRKDKLFALKQGYEVAFKEGKVDLARRLHGDFNVLAAATNRDIADTDVFEKLPRFKAPVIEPKIEDMAHKGDAAPSATARLDKTPIEPPKFDPEKPIPLKTAKAMRKAAAAASEALNEGGGIDKLEFTTDANGKIIGMNLETENWNAKEIAVADADLKSDWYKTAQENYEGSGRLTRSQVLTDTRSYYAHQKALAKMLHDGTGSPEETRYLEKRVVALQSKINKRYGDIFNKLEA